MKKYKTLLKPSELGNYNKIRSELCVKLLKKQPKVDNWPLERA